MATSGSKHLLTWFATKKKLAQSKRIIKLGLTSFQPSMSSFISTKYTQFSRAKDASSFPHFLDPKVFALGCLFNYCAMCATTVKFLKLWEHSEEIENRPQMDAHLLVQDADTAEYEQEYEESRQLLEDYLEAHYSYLTQFDSFKELNAQQTQVVKDLNLVLQQKPTISWPIKCQLVKVEESSWYPKLKQRCGQHYIKALDERIYDLYYGQLTQLMDEINVLLDQPMRLAISDDDDAWFTYAVNMLDDADTIDQFLDIVGQFADKLDAPRWNA